ncbi:alpha/beta hydrolase [Lacticaseibacillus zhaodongensis]|uniref:alpha/beta hydrolase n=1 Tax=Lacticaseibacillus zhaodongensis TaxID=2668065 RepID=UPI0012D3503D|nr:alpha/beta fold hydrolase [Lacticaseibacillus zhaodongensis]
MMRIPQAEELVGTNKNLGVVLLHSFTGSSRDMKFLAPALNAAGYGVYAPILRGHHDRSFGGPLLGGNPQDWWVDTQAAVRRMHRSYAHVAVFGLSLGGILAMRAIEELPAVVAGGVMASPIMDGSPFFTRTVQRYFDYVQHFTGAQTDRMALQPAIDQQNAAIRDFARGVAAKIDTVRKPVFIAQGGADSVIDCQTAKRTRAGLVNASVDFHWYPHADHILTVDPVHEQMEDDICSFLAGVN